MSTAEAGTFFVRAEFDGPAISNEQGNLLIESNGGEVVYNGPCGDCGKQIVGGKFPGWFGAEKAVKAFEALGIGADLYPDNNEDDDRYTYCDGWLEGRKDLLWAIAHDVQRAEALLLHAKAIANS